MSDAGPGNFDNEADIDGKIGDQSVESSRPENSEPGEHYFQERRATRIVMNKVYSSLIVRESKRKIEFSDFFVK